MSREKFKEIREEARAAVADDAAETTVALNPIVGVRTKDMLQAIQRTLLQVSKQPVVFAKHSVLMGYELLQIVGGKSELAPSPKDRRFQDPAWQGNRAYRVLLQAHLSWKTALSNWLADTNLEGMELRRAQFAVDLVTDGLAPSNNLLTNPAAIKRAIDTGGRSLSHGLNNLLHDMRENGGMPSQVDKSKFKVGSNLAITDGKVVFRNELLELIQYLPTGDTVSAIPLMVVPPQINKFYVLDLSPEKSLFKFLVGQGFHLFAVSWKNPDKSMSGFGMEQYIQALCESIKAIQSISGSKKINLMGSCSGGITSSVLAGHLQALGNTPINSLSLFVCVLSQRSEDTDLGIFASDSTLENARRQSQKRGVLEGSSLAKTFNWMRPNDLIWNYVVNNYLMGNKPPAFDVLYWNSDSTNLPATLHSDFIDILRSDPFVTANDLSICDTNIDLAKVDKDVFLVGGVTDHITPWNACYRSTKIFGGQVEYVLSNAGHIQSLINPPSNPKASYYVNRSEQKPATAEQWLDGAEKVSDSWWLYWSKWLGERSGNQKKAPKNLGNKLYPPMEDAPGTYVKGNQ
jgi:polyhydroxyalkanoate synthase